MKRKALVLLCMGMILTGMTGCSAGIRIAESTQDNIMVIMENPADGSSEESGSGEEEPNTDISGTTDLNEEAEAEAAMEGCLLSSEERTGKRKFRRRSSLFWLSARRSGV